MKKILFEMEKLKNLNSGLGQFCFHLGKEFVSQGGIFEICPTFYSPSYLKNLFGKDANYLSSNPMHKFLPLSGSEYDVWHCMHQESPYLPSSKKVKVVLTIHDLNFLFKDTYQKNKKEKKLKKLQKKVDRANAITFISNYTFELSKKYLKFKDIPLKVIYNGNSIGEYREDVAKQPTFMKEAPFLFALGIISPKKNFKSLLWILKQFKSYNLVIAGIKEYPYTTEILDLAKELKVEERLIMPGPVDEAAKYWLYQNCDAFLFPSLSEGFGLPVVEAMGMGKPVFISKFTSLPEIGGEEAYYFEKLEENSMCETFENGMEDYHSDFGKKDRIINWGKRFSWTNAAKEYLTLYKSL